MVLPGLPIFWEASVAQSWALASSRGRQGMLWLWAPPNAGAPQGSIQGPLFLTLSHLLQPIPCQIPSCPCRHMIPTQMTLAQPLPQARVLCIQPLIWHSHLETARPWGTKQGQNQTYHLLSSPDTWSPLKFSISQCGSHSIFQARSQRIQSGHLLYMYNI